MIRPTKRTALPATTSSAVHVVPTDKIVAQLAPRPELRPGSNSTLPYLAREAPGVASDASDKRPRRSERAISEEPRSLICLLPRQPEPPRSSRSSTTTTPTSSTISTATRSNKCLSRHRFLTDHRTAGVQGDPPSEACSHVLGQACWAEPAVLRAPVRADTCSCQAVTSRCCEARLRCR